RCAPAYVRNRQKFLASQVSGRYRRVGYVTVRYYGRETRKDPTLNRFWRGIIFPAATLSRVGEQAF
ncbi:MAG: hypothetical protein ACWGP1_17570, partial [Syntrophobacteria bacterium]